MMIRITITIRKDQKEWLDKHPSINVSGLLQEAIDERMQKDSNNGNNGK